MKTSETPPIKEALTAAERQYPNLTMTQNAIYFIGLALVFAICEVADSLKQVAADMPSGEK